MKKNVLCSVLIFLLYFCSLMFSQEDGLHSMENDTASIGRAYYRAMADKNLHEVASYLDGNVIFIAPLAIVEGKQKFLERVQEFFAYAPELIIRVVFGNENQAMVVFTLDYAEPIGIVETAALLTIENGLISRIELFYDGRLFEKK